MAIPRVEANGIAKDLLKEISNFLNSKNISCHFYKAKRKLIQHSTNQDVFRLQINGKDNLKKFVKKIGFINPKQIGRLKQYMAVKRIELPISAL